MHKKVTFLAGFAKSQRSWLGEALRNETFGGALLLVASLAAILLANSPLKDAFFSFRDLRLGPEALHLNLPLGVWAADALLALFFFTAGIELKHELVHGSLKNKSTALVPIAAALGGMLLPALLYAAINFNQQTSVGWGIPMATDIAFALAILAVVGRSLPIELRAFLLTLAVVDDLGAIIVIAIFYSYKFALFPLLIAVALLAVFFQLQRKEIKGWYLYLPLAIATWYFVHESGVHATVAGLALGLAMNMTKGKAQQKSAGDKALHLIHPLSAAIAVPIFAFFASGINFDALGKVDLLGTSLALGIILGLVVGKPIGVFLGAYFLARLTKASLSSGILWWDIAALGSLAGVGFTVSLLISELAFKSSPTNQSIAVLGVLIASLFSAVIATIVLLIRRKAHNKR
jgi:NhaA family Na+:H+ antiporter